MINIFNEIFGMGINPNKEELKKSYINAYINGSITKKQFDEKMQNLTIKSP